MVKYKKAMMIILIAIIALSVTLIALLLIYFGGNEITWEEFESMTPEKQMEFQNSFDSLEEFDEWLKKVQTEEKKDVPWENGGKKPKNYTWEEFESLPPEQQIIFQNSFKKTEDFEKWMVKAQEELESEKPWENGGKKPKDYTWEEFEALTAEQQMAFQNSFKSQEKFDEWMQSVAENNENEEGNIEKLPWENGGKQPKDYTWEEFEALTAEQQMAFQNSFKDADGFEKWMESVIDNEGTEFSFEKEDLFSVTWEEFETMSMEEQMIFQNSFKNIDEFDKWLKANEPK